MFEDATVPEVLDLFRQIPGATVDLDLSRVKLPNFQTIQVSVQDVSYHWSRTPVSCLCWKTSAGEGEVGYRLQNFDAPAKSGLERVGRTILEYGKFLQGDLRDNLQMVLASDLRRIARVSTTELNKFQGPRRVEAQGISMEILGDTSQFFLDVVSDPTSILKTPLVVGLAIRNIPTFMKDRRAAERLVRSVFAQNIIPLSYQHSVLYPHRHWFSLMSLVEVISPVTVDMVQQGARAAIDDTFDLTVDGFARVSVHAQ